MKMTLCSAVPRRQALDSPGEVLNTNTIGINTNVVGVVYSRARPTENSHDY